MRFEWLREIWQYRELFYFLVWRDVKVRYKQTVLGAAWAVIQPFFTMIVFTIFFQKLAKMPSDGIPYPIFSYSALVPWTYFHMAVTNAGNSLVANSNLLTKVYFPRAAIPASSAFSGIVDFAIASVVLLGIMFYYHYPPTWTMLLWPFLMLPLIMLALGTGMIFAALNVRYRDIRYALPFLIQVWLYVTPIIYPAKIIPEKYRVFMAFNPLAGIIESFRSCMLPNRPMDWMLYGISLAITVTIFAIGSLYFRKTERTFADII